MTAQQNPLASSAHNKLLSLAQELGWPKHYKNDLYHHDWTTLRDAPLPITRLIWGVRNTGTDLWIYAPQQHVLTCRPHTDPHAACCYSNKDNINPSNDWLLASLVQTGGSGSLFYYLSYTPDWSHTTGQWYAQALPHDLPKCLDFYQTLAQRTS